MTYAGLFIGLVAGAAVSTFAPVARAQEPGAAPVPEAVRALEGCWHGAGVVMGKPVEITLRNGPIALGALFLVEADSHAVADPADRYVAHLIFGGRAGTEGGVSAFYADSFGGDFTAVGTGVAASDGFEVAYVYPDAVFVNRWARTEGGLTWTIAARNAAGPEQAFAAYELTRAACVEG